MADVQDAIALTQPDRLTALTRRRAVQRLRAHDLGVFLPGRRQPVAEQQTQKCEDTTGHHGGATDARNRNAGGAHRRQFTLAGEHAESHQGADHRARDFEKRVEQQHRVAEIAMADIARDRDERQERLNRGDRQSHDRGQCQHVDEDVAVETQHVRRRQRLMCGRSIHGCDSESATGRI